MEVALYKISPYPSEAPSHFPEYLREFICSGAPSSGILSQWTCALLQILKISSQFMLFLHVLSFTSVHFNSKLQTADNYSSAWDPVFS